MVTQYTVPHSSTYTRCHAMSINREAIEIQEQNSIFRSVMYLSILICVLIGCLVDSASIHKQSSVITISVQSDLEELRCVYKEETYEDRQEFNDGNCRKCRCDVSVVICQEISCPRIHTCSETRVPEGACCPECVDERNDTISLVEFCIFDSQLYQLGDRWESDTCTHCECAEGSVVRCSAQECSVKLPCWETEENDQCCPACKVSACNTADGLKREGDVWVESDKVVVCRDHFVTVIDCPSVCSNQPHSMECAECESIEPSNHLLSCSDRNLTYHHEDGCVSVRALPLATTSCPQECTTDNTNTMCCIPVIRDKEIKHSCGNQGKKMISVPVVTKCSCHRC